MNSSKINQVGLRSAKMAILALGSIVLAACGDDPFLVQAEFKNTQDIEEGTQVMLESKQVGSVYEVDKKGDGSQVWIALNDDSVAQISGEAAIVVNRLSEGAPLEIHNRGSAKTKPLQDKQAIQGLDSMVQLGTWAIGDSFVEGDLSDYLNSFQEYLESPEFQTDKQEIKNQLRDAQQQARDAMDQLGIELQETAKELAASEESAAKALEEMGTELAPLVKELAGDGMKLAKELQKFSDSLNETNENEQLAGEAFLASLLTTLERLNIAIEEGVAEEIEKDSKGVKTEQ